MKTIIGVSILASLALFMPQSAAACPTYRSMNAVDYAFPDVIFEGEIKEVLPVLEYNEYTKKDLIVSTQFLFDVDTTLRGELPSSEVLVGYQRHSFSAPGSVDEFIKRYGRHVRVGLITPEQHKRHCREEVVQYTSGTGVKSEKLETVCDFSYYQLQSASEVPFIQTAGCANQFIFDTSKPMNLPNSGIVSGLNSSPLTSLANIFREHSDLFSPELKENSPAMASLLEEGIKIYNMDRRTAGQTKEERETTIEWAQARLRKKFLILANLSETDPMLRERLLRENLADIER